MVGYIKDMVKINMLSRNFAHDKGSTANKAPINIEWAFNSYENPISVYLDNDAMQGVQDKSNGKLSFLWLIESKKFDGGASETIKNNLEAILDSIHEKTKLASMIVSNKRWTKQHEIRHDFAMANQTRIDVFGRGIAEIPKKEMGLNDYMFSFAAENDTYDTYFTEKILDCFATGTIPIYMGTKKIVEYFNPEGILFFDGTYDLDSLTPDLYYSKMDAIKDNYERVQKYSILDDWLYENYLIHYV